jgi:hypothetical protein
MEGPYIIVVEMPESDGKEVSLVAIHNEHKLCFLMVVCPLDVEDAKAVCAQAVLHNSTPNDCTLYYAVYDVCRKTVHFCLCDPREQWFEDVAKHSMQSHAGLIAARLRLYISNNARVLQ